MKKIFLLLWMLLGYNLANAQDSGSRNAVAKESSTSANTAITNSENTDQSKRSQTNSMKKDTLTHETNGELREQKKSRPNSSSNTESGR